MATHSRVIRQIASILLWLALPSIALGQLIRPENERLPGEIERRDQVPAELEGKTTITFTDFNIIFDGGSHGASFRRENGRDLIILFLHPGWWTTQAVKDKTQPIVVDVDAEDGVLLEVPPKSPFEKRLLELLNADLANSAHSREQIGTLTRIRDCVRDRKPLDEIQERFPDAFKDVRTWTDRRGRRAEAEYIGFSNGKVHVKRIADGKRFQVAIETLSDADQAFVRSLNPAAPPKATVTQETANGPTAIPPEISVDGVLKCLKDAEMRGQGCGGTNWNGKHWSYYVNEYSPVAVPWSKTPVKVTAGFASGGQPRAHHLIEFRGPGFKFRRTEDSPKLLRVNDEE